jgi:hypothetical protein
VTVDPNASVKGAGLNQDGESLALTGGSPVELAAFGVIATLLGAMLLRRQRWSHQNR